MAHDVTTKVLTTFEALLRENGSVDDAIVNQIVELLGQSGKVSAEAVVTILESSSESEEIGK